MLDSNEFKMNLKIYFYGCNHIRPPQKLLLSTPISLQFVYLIQQYLISKISTTKIIGEFYCIPEKSHMIIRNAGMCKNVLNW